MSLVEKIKEGINWLGEKTNYGIAATMIMGTLYACNPELQQEEPTVGCQTDDDCKNERICRNHACIDPQNNYFFDDENCSPRAERVCFGNFVYWADSCGILAEEEGGACGINENCRDGYCVDGEVIFYDECRSSRLELWEAQGGARISLESGGLLRVSRGIIESVDPKLYFYDINEENSLVLEFVMSLGSLEATFSGGVCVIYDNGEVSCPATVGAPRVNGVNDPSQLHFYQIRLDENEEEELGIRLRVDGQEIVNSTVPTLLSFNLISLLCARDSESLTEDACWLGPVRVLRVDAYYQ